MHTCVNNLTIIGSDNGLSPGRRQAIIWASAGLLLIAPFGVNLSEILIKNYSTFSRENAFESVVCETAAILPRPQYLRGLDYLAVHCLDLIIYMVLLFKFIVIIYSV